MLKSSLWAIGVHICSTKNPPKRLKPPTTTTARRRSITRSSQLRSSTTVPSTLSYDAFLCSGSSGETGSDLRVMTPQRMNSPMRGKTKLDMFPILMPLKAVILVMLPSIGRRSLRQRTALSQKAKEPAAIDRSMNSHLHDFNPSMKSAHSTSLNEK